MSTADHRHRHHHHQLKSHLSPDVFLHVPANLSPPPGCSVSARTRPPRIIFFVTGNPGLIAYYHAFLSLLSTSGPATDCVVAGFSLGGFEIGDCRDGNSSRNRSSSSSSSGVREEGSRGEGGGGWWWWLEGLQFPDRAATTTVTATTTATTTAATAATATAAATAADAGSGRVEVYGLEAQIALTESRVWALVRRVGERWGEGVADESNGKDGERDGEGEVVLMGHSVGAYIVLELIRRHAQRQDRSSHPGNSGPAFAIKGAVLLTPTIVDIAQSASGRVLTPLVTYIPGFAMLAAGAAKALGGVLGRAQLRGVVSWVTGMPDRGSGGDGDGAGAGMSPLDTTVAFLRSERGVRQALEMAGQEMKVIGKDRWGSEVWGAGAAAVVTGAMRVDDDRDWERKRMRAPKLVIYFAKTDHWVADQTREELLRVRGQLEGKGEEWKPTMVVDEDDGLVHGWCIGQSELVAAKVGKWVGEILGEGEDGR